jgi:hypothetical protein
LEVFLCHIFCRYADATANIGAFIAKNSSLKGSGNRPWLSWLVEQAVARTSATFKQADLVRAVKAARAAGLPVTATHITPDGTIRLIHTDSATLHSSDYDRFEAEL